MTLRNILVTGGAGFIGSNFVDYILTNFPDDKVIVFDKLTYSGNLTNLRKWQAHPGYSFIQGDIASDADLKSAIDDAVTHVVHFAAESHVDRSIANPEDFVQTNIVGTYRILERLRELLWHQQTAKRMLHVSTDEVFGSLGADGFFTEHSNYKPNSPYSASKASSDMLVRSYYHTYNFPVVTTNCSNNYGPYQFPEKLIPLTILNCLQRKKIPVYGKGDNIRDWIHVHDHCAGVELALTRGQSGETYLLGGSSESTNLELVHMICKIMDELAPGDFSYTDLITHVEDRAGHDFRYAIDSSKAEKELGWSATYNFKSGLQDTVQWYLENQDWWQAIVSGEYQHYYETQYGN